MKALRSLSLYSMRGLTLGVTTKAGAIGGGNATGGGMAGTATPGGITGGAGLYILGKGDGRGATRGVVPCRTAVGATICGGAARPATDRGMVASKAKDKRRSSCAKKPPTTHPENPGAATLMLVYGETHEELSDGRQTQPVGYCLVG